jgi:predicted alpha/beta-hydrolase family hydrolase
MQFDWNKKMSDQNAIGNAKSVIQKTTQGLARTVYQNNNLQDKAIVLIAHGAGAGNQNEFMDSFCYKLAEQNIQVISFNFLYMQTMYETGKRRPPNPNKQLLQQFEQEILAVDSNLPLFIAGKSMGGRIASQICASTELGPKLSFTPNIDVTAKLRGCIALGYPFMPPGKPEKFTDRTQHFKALTVPLLINQGERDTFGSLLSLSSDEHKDVLNSKMVDLLWLPSGDHSFKPLKSSGISLDDNIDTAVMNTLDFINKQI